LLEISDGVLSNGSIVPVPKFVLMACERIQSEIESEGIFRKSGSLKRQRSIRKQLEKGKLLNNRHDVNDVASLLKFFFRELPEPLIPPGAIQEALLKCVSQSMTYKEKRDGVLMVMLLLPPININTLAFLLQFLKSVAKYADKNLMTIDNLIKVFTPTIMPLAMLEHHKLNLHFEVVKLLFQNFNLLGVIPDRISTNEHVQLPIVHPVIETKRRSLLSRFGRICCSGFATEDFHESEAYLPVIPVASNSSKKQISDMFDTEKRLSRKK
jgi:Rho GTPase-activating protein 11